MAYELRLDGRTITRCDTEQEALALVRQALAADPDHEPEVIDLATGKPVAPGASHPDRDDLANKVGY